MSTAQRNDARVISVDPPTADILRRQTLIILEANHYYFEEILEFGPEAQHALSVIYRDAFAVLDAIGWRRPKPPPATVDVPFTAGFAAQLRQRRYDLGHTNIDRLATRDAEVDPSERARIDSEIASDRRSATVLDRLTCRSLGDGSPVVGSSGRVMPQRRPQSCISSRASLDTVKP